MGTKKIRKRLLAVMLACAVICGLMPMSVSAGTVSGADQDGTTEIVTEIVEGSEEETEGIILENQEGSEVEEIEETKTSEDMVKADTVKAETTTVSGTITWVNREYQTANQRPASTTVRLYAGNTDTGKYITVEASDSDTETAFSFADLPKTDDAGNAIAYRVIQDTVSNYETTYSADTLTITNSYIGGLPKNHTFSHIDVRIAGASLEIDYCTKDANGNVISKTSDKITAYVTNVESVSIISSYGIQTYTGFSKSANYEYRKLNGVSISSQTLSASSGAALVVDLVDANGKTYDDVSVTYGLGGIMEAAYNCDGYRNGSFDGLDFNVGNAKNYTIEMTSYGLGISIDKKIKDGSTDPQQFSGNGGEFTFELAEYEGAAATGRTWTDSNDANGTASIVITYPYTSMDEMKAYAGKTYTYVLKEKTGTIRRYFYDLEEYTFTVKFTLESQGDSIILKPAIQEEACADGKFSFENLIMKDHSVTIKKVDEQGNTVEGAEFTLYSDAGCSNEILSFSAGSYELSTSAAELTPYLPTSGNITTLYLKETEPPTGYTGSSAVHSIEIRYSDLGYQITVDDQRSLTVTNSKITDTATVHDSITINKVDASGKALSGATFAVYADKECSKKVTSFKAGSCTLSTENADLKDYLPEPGSSTALYLKETTAPTGYTASSTIYTITISANESTDWNADHSKYITTRSYTMKIEDADSLNVTNTKASTPSTTPKNKSVATGDHANPLLWIGIICLSMIAAFITIIFGKRNRRVISEERKYRK